MPAVPKMISLAVIAAVALLMPATAGAKTCTKRTTGVCKSQGKTVKLANRAQTLRLKSVAVKIVGAPQVLPQIGPFGDWNDSATAKGRYVVFTVTVTNRGNSPLDVILGLNFSLGLGREGHRATYSEAFNAENLLGSPALIHGDDDGGIQPGLSATGYIAFDVAPSRTSFVRRDGNLIVEDDSDSRLGFIRTYR
jgi:hypothetical protein